MLWSISPNIGTIVPETGLYTAPSSVTSQQTVTVTATGPDIGAGAHSGTATITLVPRVSASITVPSGLVATVVSNSEVDLSWTASTEPGGSIAGYNIYHSGVWVGSTPGTTYADFGLIAATSYAYTVAAYDVNGVASAQSAVVSRSTLSGVQPSLLAYYTFNEGTGTVLHDFSGNGNNGTIYSAIWTDSGKTGGALRFGLGGIMSYVVTPNANVSSAVTLEAWVNPASLTLGDVILEYQEGRDCWFGLFDSGYGGPVARVTTQGCPSDVSVSRVPWVPMSSNTWTHMAMTYDGTTVQLFVNGVLAASQQQSGIIDNTSQPMYIGGDPLWDSDRSDYNRYFDGLIDEVRIYNRALSQSEIQNDMMGAANVGLNLVPAIATLTPLKTQQFTATVIGTGNTAVSWSVALGPGAQTGALPGLIDLNGMYTAPPSVTTQYTVVVTAQSQADPTKNASAIVTLMPAQQAASPTFSPVGGSYTAAQTVAVSSTTAGATIRYTLDGTAPSESAGTVYTAPFLVAGTTTVKAIAYVTGLTDSPVASATYSILAASPTFSPVGGSYTAAQTVTLSSTTAGATIRYTLDGTAPSESAGTVYTAPFSVAGTTTVKAIAYAYGPDRQSGGERHLQHPGSVADL